MAKDNWVEIREESFTNSYNFVPFEGRCDRLPLSSYREGEELLTGYFECRAELLTPLCIPNTSSEAALIPGEQGKSFDFYSNDDLRGKDWKEIRENPGKPELLATEIRGVSRSTDEAGFNGCVSTADITQELGRRSPFSRTPGILKRKGDKWLIQECRVEGIENRYNCREGEKIGSNSYFHIGEPGIKGKGRKCFKFITEKKLEDVPDEAIDNLKIVLAEYSNDSINKRLPEESSKVLEKIKCPSDVLGNRALVKDQEHTGYVLAKKLLAELEGPSKKEKAFEKCLPVYYCSYQASGKKRMYLSPACIGRVAFYRTVNDVLEAQGGYQPCISREHVCPTCALYGMVSGQEGKPDGCGSRVRFTDGVLEDSEDFDKSWFYNNGEPVVLPPMGEPRIGAVEFYTEVPEGVWDEEQGVYKYWTYDYYIDEYGDSPVKKPLDKITFRGRKFYWHQEFDRSKFGRVAGDKKLGNMEQAVRLLAPEHDGKRTRFRFRVYFEKITPQELQRLRWSLNLGDKSCAQKIGHGKPLGLGSVKMIPSNKVHLRTISPEDGLWKMETKTWEEVFGNRKLEVTDEMRTLQTILSWTQKPGDVSYPKGDDGKGKENSNASHQWFRANRKIKSDSEMKPNFYKVLPAPEVEVKAVKQKKDGDMRDMRLYKMVNIKPEKGRENGGNVRYNKGK